MFFLSVKLTPRRRPPFSHPPASMSRIQVSKVVGLRSRIVTGAPQQSAVAGVLCGHGKQVLFTGVFLSLLCPRVSGALVSREVSNHKPKLAEIQCAATVNNIALLVRRYMAEHGHDYDLRIRPRDATLAWPKQYGREICSRQRWRCRHATASFRSVEYNYCLFRVKEYFFHNSFLYLTWHVIESHS